MAGRQQPVTAAGWVRSRRAPVLVAAFLLPIGAVTGVARGSAERGAADGRLTVFVGGPPPAQVSVAATPGPGSDPHPCYWRLDGTTPPDQGCEYIVPAGRVTLEAEPSSSFLGWSDPECGASSTCSTTVDDATSIVATFAPVGIVLAVAGEGKVVARTLPAGPESVCTSPATSTTFDPTYCVIDYPAIADVELEAVPATRVAVQWDSSSFCDPGPDPASTRCRARITFRPSEIAVGLGQDPPPIPFVVSVDTQVERVGDGTGTVTSAGPGFDCGSDCSERIKFGKRVVLDAAADDGSLFVRWAGVCSTTTRCEFHAGPVTTIRAIFARRSQQPPPPPPTTPPPPPPPTGPAEGLRLSARVLRVSVVQTRTQRVVVARLRVNQAATGGAQVRRGRATLAAKAIRVSAGASTIRLPLRRSTRRGPARLEVTLRSRPAQVATVRARFVIPRRR